MKPPQDDSQAIYQAEVARFRESFSKGRSATQLALFDLLVARSADERPPKEIEIAVALFGEHATIDSGSDSGVRVYVHRLRKRMEEHYAGTTGPRLVIPKGAYRIVLDHIASAPATPAPMLWLRKIRQVDLSTAIGLGLIACALAGLVGWLLWPTAGTHRAVETHPGLRLLVNAASDPFQPVIVVGDNLLLARSDDQRSVRRMVLDPAVRTRDDFSTYLKAHPETFYKLYDFDLHFSPVGAIKTGWAVGDFLHGGSGKESAPVPLLPLSSLTDDMLATHDIVFVGRLSQLRALGDEVFARSRFSLAKDDLLVDRKTGQRFSATQYAVAPSGNRTDYGYFAVRTGSGGRRLVILGGIGDGGSEGVAALLRSPRALAQIRHAVANARHFEALFAITTRNAATFHHRLIAAYPLP